MTHKPDEPECPANDGLTYENSDGELLPVHVCCCALIARVRGQREPVDAEAALNAVVDALNEAADDLMEESRVIRNLAAPADDDPDSSVSHHCNGIERAASWVRAYASDYYLDAARLSVQGEPTDEVDAEVARYTETLRRKPTERKETEA